jgi:hypothetical protein
MDGYKRFIRIQKIKYTLDNSYTKGYAKEYLSSKYYIDLNVSYQSYVTEHIKGIDFSEYIIENLDRTISYTEYITENL